MKRPEQTEKAKSRKPTKIRQSTSGCALLLDGFYELGRRPLITKKIMIVVIKGETSRICMRGYLMN